MNLFDINLPEDEFQIGEITLCGRNKIYKVQICFFDIKNYMKYMNPLFFSEDECYENQQQKSEYVLSEHISGRLAAKYALSYRLGKNRCNEIIIKKGCLGYPYIISPLEMNGYDISISHCKTMTIAAAFSSDILFGVDIEQISGHTETVVQRILDEKEKRIIDEVSSHCSKNILYTSVWCSKEAISKLLRIGFSSGLEVFAIKKIEVNSDRIIISFRHFCNLEVTALLFLDCIFAYAYPTMESTNFYLTRNNCIQAIS